MIFGVLRHQGGRIAEENRARSPVSGSVRRSFDPGCGHLDRAGRGQDLPRLVGSVAHHQSAAAGVAVVGEAGDVVVDLGLQGFGEHPPGALADELVDQGRTARAGVIGASGSRNYGEHGSYLPDRRWRAGLA